MLKKNAWHALSSQFKLFISGSSNSIYSQHWNYFVWSKNNTKWKGKKLSKTVDSGSVLFSASS